MIYDDLKCCANCNRMIWISCTDDYSKSRCMLNNRIIRPYFLCGKWVFDKFTKKGRENNKNIADKI